MNNYQRQSGIVREFARSHSTQSSQQVLTRHRIFNVVPSGTVASRVLLLEDHTTPAYTPRQPTQSHNCEQSCTGFGRRMMKCFGKPASRNEHPDEDSQVGTEHSFLGLSNTRTKYDEHGITDSIKDRRETYSRASEIKGQIQSQALAGRAQRNADSPRSVTSRHASARWTRGSNGQEIEFSSRVDGKKDRAITQTSIFPTLTSGIGHSDIYRREAKLRHDNTIKSDITTLTNSTARRQSVREIFADYGIERPYGLVPDKEPSVRDNAEPRKSKILCQNCSWYNHETSSWCIKCRVVLRRIKHVESPSLISPKGEPYYVNNVPESIVPSSPDSSAKQTEPTTSSKRQTVLFKPKLASLQKPDEIPCQASKILSPTTKFPLSNMAHPLARKGSQRASPRKYTPPELPVALKLLRGSRTTSFVKDSPFLIADQIFCGRSTQAPSVLVRMGRNDYQKTQMKKSQLQRGEGMSNDFDCESPDYQTTHENSGLSRHSVLYPHKNKHTPEDTDNGYAAEMRFAGDSSSFHPSLADSALFCISTQRSNQSFNSERPKTSHQSHGSVYVECHGYPRTGHDRHGGPVASGDLGQCQHCIDDCQCTACQNTHHSVRCCLNEDHKAMAHHHSSKAYQSINHLGCPTFSSQCAEKETSSSVIRSPSFNDCQIPVTYQGLSYNPTPEKSATVSISKNSNLLKDQSKLPTRPPWVLDPKTTTKSSVTSRRSKLELDRSTVDITFDVRAIADPLPLFKKFPTLPLPPICDESGSELAPSRINRCSRKTSKMLSDVFKFGEKTAVPILSRKLLDASEQLRRIEKDCEDKVEVLTGEIERNVQTKATICEEKKPSLERKKSVSDATASSVVKKKVKRGLTLINTKPSPPCPNNALVKEHRLSDDATIDENGNLSERVPVTTKIEEHESVGKNRVIASQSETQIHQETAENSGNLPLQGVTIVVHMEGKDDLIIKADLRKGMAR